jgi:hypothetical protein
MNYCTIQEAWGKGNYISNQLKKTQESEVKKKPIENFQNQHLEKKEIVLPVKQNNNFNCNTFVKHLKTCRKCQIQMREQFRPKILENFEDIIQTNRDIIVLILVGLCLMIFLNMISNITSNTNNANKN